MFWSKRRGFKRSSLYIWASLLVIVLLPAIVKYLYPVLVGVGELKEDSIQYTSGKVRQRVVSDLDAFQLVQENCRIPFVRRYTAAYNVSKVKRLDPRFEACSSSNPSFTKLIGNVLHLIDDSLNDCCVRKISRSFQDPKDYFRRSRKCQTFIDKVVDVSKMEFMEAICNEHQNGTLMANPKARRDFHAHVPILRGVSRKVVYWKRRLGHLRSQNDRPASINLLVIDSTSRTEAYRALPKTMDFLVNKMGFVDFKGHHPLGEPTAINTIAMLMGIKHEDFVTKYHPGLRDHWDSSPFIWKEFDRLSFVTGYLEDLPRTGTFNHGGQRGFVQQPVDLYLRPLGLAHSTVNSHSSKTICFGKQTFLEFLLDYQIKVLKTLHEVPSFIISWPAWPWHDFRMTLSLEDNTFLNYFQEIWKENHLLENTWLIITSDHAFYKGTYATTHEGLIERRNVPLLIRPPNRVSRQDPKMLETLLWNSEIITSHFDVYRTLLDLAKRVNENADSVEGNSKVGQSLLEPLKPNRACDDAGITETMCACNLPVPEDDIKLMFSNITILPPLAINQSQILLNLRL